MKVPLKLDTFDNGTRQYLKFWRNGRYDVIESPILPYCYCKDSPPLTAKVQRIHKQLLYDRDYDKPLCKSIFRTVSSMREAAGGLLESDIKFMDRVFMDGQELIEKYAHTGELKILAYDIETDSYLTFPTGKQNAIIAIGLQLIIFRDGQKPELKEIEIKMSEDHLNDKPIIDWFIEKIKEYDPDVYTQFNGNFFDWPYIFERCEIHKIDTSVFSRDDKEPWVRTIKTPDGKTYNEVYFGGRSNYDISLRSVQRDQNLFKKAPKNRKMKTVCRVYELDNVIEEPPEVMSNMRSIVNTQQLHDYLYSDIRCTTFLCNMYLPAIIGMAEKLGITLDACVMASPAYIPDILLGSEFSKMGIVSDMTVGQAYPYESVNKQGALVGCFKPGLYKDGIRKLDVQSYYPNLIRTLNLCPTTTRIVEFRDEMEEYNAHMTEDNFLILSIPDDKMKKQVIIEIDFNRRGFTSSFVDYQMNERLDLKAQMKELDPHSPEYAVLDVNQLNIKVIMNSITGYFGQPSAKFGSLACYIAITGTGRYLIQKLIDYVESTVALDTDGIVVDSDESEDEVNEWMEKYVLEHLKVPKNYIILEEEPYKAAYFREGKKQYLMIEENKLGEDVLVIHGISFKGSSLPQLYSDIIEDIGFKMLTSDENLKEVVEQYYDRQQWSLERLVKNTKVKPPEQYASKGSPIGKQLAIQYEKRFGEPITNETQLGYVKVKRKVGSTYNLVTIFDKIEDIHGIDYDYYTEIVDNALERLGLEHLMPKNRYGGKVTVQKGLFDFEN